jgi:hypothetical protein
VSSTQQSAISKWQLAIKQLVIDGKPADHTRQDLRPGQMSTANGQLLIANCST